MSLAEIQEVPTGNLILLSGHPGAGKSILSPSISEMAE